MNEVSYPAIAELYSAWKERNGTAGVARDDAYRFIKELIISLDLKPGMPVSDKALASQLEISRTPVREALILLMSTNMIVVKPQSGTFIAPIDIERLYLEQFKRYAMEKEAVSLAITRFSQGLAEKYDRINREYAACVTAGGGVDHKKLLKLDNEFHRIAFDAAGLGRHYDNIFTEMEHFERFRSLTLLAGSPGYVLHDHMSIAEAVCKGDKELAGSLLETHLFRFRENLDSVREQYPDYFTL